MEVGQIVFRDSDSYLYVYRIDSKSGDYVKATTIWSLSYADHMIYDMGEYQHNFSDYIMAGFDMQFDARNVINKVFTS